MTLEAALQCVGLLMLSMGLWVVMPSTPSVLLLLLLLAPVPLLLLAALRFGVLGSSVSLLLIAVPAAWLSVYRNSPFSISGGQFNIHIMQLWLLAFGLLVHTLAIQSQEQWSIQEQLSAPVEVERTGGLGLLTWGSLGESYSSTYSSACPKTKLTGCESFSLAAAVS